MRSSDFSFKTREPERATAYLNWWWFDFRQDRGVDPRAWHVSSKVDDAQIGGLFYFSIETVHPASEEVVGSGLAPASERSCLAGTGSSCSLTQSATSWILVLTGSEAGANVSVA